MATVIEIPCPDCERILKVPESAFGKKIKCKHCGAKIDVEEVDLDDEDEKSAKKKGKEKPSTLKTSKPGGAVKPKKEEPKPVEKPQERPAVAAPYKFADDDDEGDGGATPNPLGVVDAGEDIPRCPHCAQELDPPDAVICIHCGFNNVTRVKAESKKVWAPTSEDYLNHLGPGILALIGCIGLIVLDIICLVNMRDWLTDTFLQKDEKNAQGEIDFYVKPGAFITFIFAATLMPIIKLGHFAIKRLAIDNQPTEQVKK